MAADGRGIATGIRTTGSDPVDETSPAGEIAVEPLASLGDSAAEVREALLDGADCPRRDAGSIRATCLYHEIAALYDQRVVPAEVASRLWSLLADEPEFRSLGLVEDRAGREGIGISIIPEETPEFRLILIISPENGQLLGTEEILIRDDPDTGLDAPAVHAFSAVLEARYADEQGPRAP